MRPLSEGKAPACRSGSNLRRFYNRIFAKLGSDMKKPDATTVIDSAHFRETVWPLPASDLLYVGRATAQKLARYGIHTLGDLARTDTEFLHRLLGKMGSCCGCSPTAKIHPK